MLERLIGQIANADPDDSGRPGSSHLSPTVGSTIPGMPHPSPHLSTSQPFQSGYLPPPSRDNAIDPTLAASGLNGAPPSQEQGYKNAIKAWSRFKFVRAGWFTPAEAIEYIT